MYSEWEENNFAYLNSNDFNGKVFELEICLQSNEENIYSEFYARCFSFRTDTGLRVKINGLKNEVHYTKMNKFNQSVIGVGVFLRKDEFNLLTNANTILIEGFFALNKVVNTYGVAIKLVKEGEHFEAQFANTYKLKSIRSINDVAH